MSEQTVEQVKRPLVITDKEARNRYEYVVQKGKEIFENSALVDPAKEITQNDLDLIVLFHREVSPTNSNHPWRMRREEGRAIEREQIVDSSFFSNWEAPGGPLEHIQLASKAAQILVEEIRKHLKKPEDISINPLHAAAAAALHDEGREVTHLFYTNDLIGRRLLQRIGIREDILAVLPSEEIMQIPLNKSMDEAIQTLSAETVIVRIADEFGKRVSGTNRLYQPEDYTAWDKEAWAKSYIARPPSGRSSDQWMREHMELHVANVPRYFQALDNWVRTRTTLTLTDLTRIVNRELSQTLPKNI